MIWLPDVNVLIGLIDATHLFHDAAHDWFAGIAGDRWATCAMTENAVLRIVSHPKYPNSAGSPAAVAPILSQLRSLPGHEFWSDDLSLLDPGRVDAAAIETHAQVTDSYLLALATSRGGKLATFDRRLSVRAVPRGRQALHVIQAAA